MTYFEMADTVGQRLATKTEFEKKALKRKDLGEMKKLAQELGFSGEMPPAVLETVKAFLAGMSSKDMHEHNRKVSGEKPPEPKTTPKPKTTPEPEKIDHEFEKVKENITKFVGQLRVLTPLIVMVAREGQDIVRTVSTAIFGLPLDEIVKKSFESQMRIENALAMLGEAIARHLDKTK